MLIEMSVTNFRSFRETQTFTLVKGGGDEMVATHTFNVVAANNNIVLLRSTAIYGPNASGKSNLLLALQTMRQIVLESALNLQRGDKLPVTPFRLSPDTRQHPSKFEVTFLVGSVRYQYGFAATAERIHEEWLRAYPKSRTQRWFSRAWNPENQRYDWELGTNLTGEKPLWQRATRDNALFLSTAVQLNSEQLQPVFDWFKNTLRPANMGGWGPTFSASLCESSDKARIMDFLRAADLPIDDILVESRSFGPEALPTDMPEPLRNVIAGNMKDKKIFDIKSVHKDDDGKPVTFDFEDESDGTRKLFSFAGLWIDSLTNGHVLLIDELHDNLHPHLVQFLVQLFNHPQTNPNNAQLIFTTHETSILNKDVLRRDQIWFCEKDKRQATLLYPMKNFSPHKSQENLERSYRLGRYGAVPFIRSLKQTG